MIVLLGRSQKVTNSSLLNRWNLPLASVLLLLAKHAQIYANIYKYRQISTKYIVTLYRCILPLLILCSAAPSLLDCTHPLMQKGSSANPVYDDQHFMMMISMKMIMMMMMMMTMALMLKI